MIFEEASSFRFAHFFSVALIFQLLQQEFNRNYKNYVIKTFKLFHVLPAGRNIGIKLLSRDPKLFLIIWKRRGKDD